MTTAAIPKTSTIVYVGPVGQESPLFGPLEPGERYQCETEFAGYLCRHHPDYWQRPATVSAPAAKE